MVVGVTVAFFFFFSPNLVFILDWGFGASVQSVLISWMHVLLGIRSATTALSFLFFT